MIQFLLLPRTNFKIKKTKIAGRRDGGMEFLPQNGSIKRSYIIQY